MTDKTLRERLAKLIQDWQVLHAFDSYPHKTRMRKSYEKADEILAILPLGQIRALAHSGRYASSTGHMRSMFDDIIVLCGSAEPVKPEFKPEHCHKCDAILGEYYQVCPTCWGMIKPEPEPSDNSFDATLKRTNQHIKNIDAIHQSIMENPLPESAKPESEPQPFLRITYTPEHKVYQRSTCPDRGPVLEDHMAKFETRIADLEAFKLNQAEMGFTIAGKFDLYDKQLADMETRLAVLEAKEGE